MDVLDRIEAEAMRAALVVKLEIEFIDNCEYEEGCEYRAYNEEFDVFVLGDTKDEAREAAMNSIAGKLMNNLTARTHYLSIYTRKKAEYDRRNRERLINPQ